ncbi:MAG: ribonuclease H-like domain-containing protein [Armatimonadetes bacterium]|nr:ribonuclease H-like domain-containing protein [Armatimonadota bacterium]
MAGDDLRKRIEALNKKPLRNVPEIETPRTVPAESQARTRSKSRDFGPIINLEDVIEGVASEATAGPGYYLVEKPATELEAEAVLIHQRFARIAGHPDGTAAERITKACKSEHIAPEEVVFLDLETTGLSMTPVFLIGTMECRDHGFVFKQYLARDYSEETSIIAAFAERLNNTRLLITFNGKCFDVPFLQNRALASGLRLHGTHHHLDLLHEARRVYGRTLPNCRLQTLEQMICGRYREDDIPGAEIPKAYHEFVRTGNADKIGRIMQHNLYDLLTMADLMHRMWNAAT